MKWLLLWLIPFAAHAADCAKAWPDDKNALVTCEINWGSGTSLSSLQLVTEKATCEFPEGKKQDCAWLRSCVKNKKGELGASTFLAGKDLNDFCSVPSFDLFASSGKGPTAWIECDASHHAIKLRLESPDKKIRKICSLPKFEENNP